MRVLLRYSVPVQAFVLCVYESECVCVLCVLVRCVCAPGIPTCCKRMLHYGECASLNVELASCWDHIVGVQKEKSF